MPQSLRVPAGCRRRPTRGRKRGQRVLLPSLALGARAALLLGTRELGRPALSSFAVRTARGGGPRFGWSRSARWIGNPDGSTRACVARGLPCTPRALTAAAPPSHHPAGRRHVRPPVAMSISVASTGSGREGQNEESLCHCTRRCYDIPVSVCDMAEE